MSSAKRKYPARDLKLLWALSAGRCAYPGCRLPCIAKPSAANDGFAIVGDIAHVYPHSGDGPRGQEKVPDDLDRNSYGNWVLLCASHHRLVDGQPHSHPADWLLHMKMKHEHWIHVSLGLEHPRLAQLLPVPVTTGKRIYRICNKKYHPLQTGARVPPLGRFDDPFGEFSVLYAATSARTARREFFSHFGGSSAFLASAFTEKNVWFEDRNLAEIQTSNLKLFRLDNDGENLARRGVKSSLGEFADVRISTTKDRRVSQGVARWIYDLPSRSPSDEYDGILYPSRFGHQHADMLVALFPSALPKLRLIRVTSLDPSDFS